MPEDREAPQVQRVGHGMDIVRPVGQRAREQEIGAPAARPVDRDQPNARLDRRRVRGGAASRREAGNPWK